MTPMPPDPQDQAPAPQVVVCIAAMGDGSYSVYMQGDDDSGQDPSMAGADDQQDQPQTAPDIDSALQMAKQMLGAESDEESQEAAPQDGNAPLSPADAQSAWKQMAAKKKPPMGM